MDSGGLVRLGNALVVAGLLLLAGGGFWALGLESGSVVQCLCPLVFRDVDDDQRGCVMDKGDNPAWETKPFVSVHYGYLTSLVGAGGNAVIGGHVVTLNEGNVFRNLYRVDLSDRIEVWDDQDREHDFFVVD